ncbi:MAG: uroporphyrinogen decarboxylase family protein [Candidatus Humimicrobiaceae bacterium]
MTEFRIPIKKPKPDIDLFINEMKGKIILDKPPLVEYLIDSNVMKPIIENMIGRKWIEKTSVKTDHMGGQWEFNKDNVEIMNSWLDNEISFWYHMGYDFIRIEVSLSLPAITWNAHDTAKGAEGKNRPWQAMTEGVIKNWEDFEKYTWPQVKEQDFYLHNYICDKLPDGMGFITCHAGGVFEHTMRLMGYEGLCLNLIDDIDLVKAVVNKLGNIIYDYNKNLLEISKLSAIFQGDDFGFNTQTLIAPADIRKYFLPWHKKFAQLCHEKGKPYYLHSCGKIDLIMEDLINDVKIDGKHSFQDKASPVIEAKEKYGDRICLLGGVDIDKLARLESKELRQYVRNIIDNCSPNGRFAIGSGNSIPSYVPVENYLTMLDEALR